MVAKPLRELSPRSVPDIWPRWKPGVRRLNGHLITPVVEQAMKTRERLVQEQNIAKQLEQKQ